MVHNEIGYDNYCAGMPSNLCCCFFGVRMMGLRVPHLNQILNRVR